LTEIHHPPVVKNVALWTLRGVLVNEKWTARIVGESIDRVGLKEFWDAEEIEGLYRVEKVVGKEEGEKVTSLPACRKTLCAENLHMLCITTMSTHAERR
jgi:hypothetical protein